MARTQRQPARSNTCGAGSEKARARAEAEQQLVDTVRTLAKELPAHPERKVGPLFADLFSALPGVEAPEIVHAAARSAREARADPDARATFFALVTQLWHFLRASGALDAGRARVLAERLGPCADHPALLFYLEADAAAHGLPEARSAFAAELDRRFPAFRRGRGHAAVDGALLEALGATPQRAPGLALTLHPGGQLAALRAPGEGGPELTLERAGGRGRFTHTGRRGGYGFHVDERYADGQVHATLYSPWHDGATCSEDREWVCWVLECVGAIVEAAERAAARPRTRAKRARAR